MANNQNSPAPNLDELESMIQSSVAEDGSIVVKQMKPLTLALYKWVKSMGWEDSIDIADDENSAQFSFTITSSDEDKQFKCFFNTDEESSVITFCIYYFDDQVDEEKAGAAMHAVLEKNLSCVTGQFQLIDEYKTLRYFAGINFANTAPNYRLLNSLFNDGNYQMESFIDDFIEVAMQ
jgi:hypothetical protein